MTLVDAHVGLEETNVWLDTEEQILEKMPLLQPDQIKVSSATW